MTDGHHFMKTILRDRGYERIQIIFASPHNSVKEKKKKEQALFDQKEPFWVIKIDSIHYLILMANYETRITNTSLELRALAKDHNAIHGKLNALVQFTLKHIGINNQNERLLKDKLQKLKNFMNERLGTFGVKNK